MAPLVDLNVQAVRCKARMATLKAELEVCKAQLREWPDSRFVAPEPRLLGASLRNMSLFARVPHENIESTCLCLEDRAPSFIVLSAHLSAIAVSLAVSAWVGSLFKLPTVLGLQ